MTVLLLILKIIGIILLVVLALLLLLVLLILFVPLRYRLEARFQEKLKARADLSWLLKLIHVRMEAINLQIRVKILALGHCLKKMYLGNWGNQKPEETLQEDDMDYRPEKKAELMAQTAPKPEQTVDNSKPVIQAEKREEEKAEKKSKKDKARQAAQKAREKYESVFESLERRQEETVRGEETIEPAEEEDALAFMEKLRSYTEKAVDFWDDEENQKAVQLIIKELQKVGKHLQPTAFLIEGELGLKDPALTGRIVAWVWRLYPFYGEHIRLDGLYDQEKVNVYVKIRGRLRIGFFVGVAIRLYMNRQIRGWIKHFRNKEGEDKAPESKDQSGKKAA